VSRVSSLALQLDFADGEINIIMHDNQAFSPVQIAPHQRCHTLSTGIHIGLGLDAQHRTSGNLPWATERLGLALSYRNPIALGQGINNVKTQIMPCMAIALSRVAQPHDYIHTFTTISVHCNCTITACPALALPEV
jgi:hypothetical protein